jgi:DNA-directed RNA polymerase subunit RPC12/RpoP
LSQLVVATECPNCGAPLDVSEGANTIRCGNCRSNLLVTGRKQVLSYYVPSKTTEDAARSVARSGFTAAQIVRADLYFIPYYRLTGHDFTWQRRAPEPVSGDEPSRDAMVSLLRDEQAEGRALVAAVLTAGRSSTDAAEGGPVQLVDRYIEKSFVARALPEFAAYSLGVRSQVLRVGLMRPERLAQVGEAVAVGIDVDAAMTRGLQEPGARIVSRQVLARILSIIYFPYWVVELQQGSDGWLTLVDGVTGSVAQPRSPLSLRQSLDVAASGDQPTAGFRPLVCPNCGWDLPVSADDVVFFCASCSKAWLLHGTEMTEVPHEIAAVAGVVDAAYLPFWRFDPGCCVPAFRYRRLKVLADLTRRLSTKPLRYERWTGERPQVRGCFYDAEDAGLLAQFVAAGQQHPAADGVRRAALVWLPFKRAGQELVDPFTGMGLQEGLIV